MPDYFKLLENDSSYFDLLKESTTKKPVRESESRDEALRRKVNGILEKWGKDVEIKSTGEHADKTVAQLKKEIAALRGKPGNKEKMGELLFALRAKQGWKKHTGL